MRFAVILATILAMALAYLGGTLVSAYTGPPLTSTGASTCCIITAAQWVALEAAGSLLLLDGEGDTTTYLPLVLKR